MQISIRVDVQSEAVWPLLMLTQFRRYPPWRESHVSLCFIRMEEVDLQEDPPDTNTESSVVTQ